MLHGLRLLLLWTACLTLPRAVSAQDAFSFGNDVTWEGFGIGSWKLVRIYKDSLNAAGDVESTRTDETRTTLFRVSPQTYTVQIDVTVEVAGKRFASDPKLVTRRWNGTHSGQTVEVKELDESSVVITGHRYPTRVRQVLMNGKDAIWQSKVYYSERPPYVLRMETTAADAVSKNKHFDSLVEVIGLEMPHRVLAEIKTTSHVRVVEKLATGEEKVTVEVQCPQVPGWVVSHSSKLLDRSGRVIQRSTLELLDYEARPEQDRVRPELSRRRGRLRARTRRPH